jgi:hypothetical protein
MYGFPVGSFCVFHGFIAVAPLKLPDVGGGRCRGVRFPRPRRRGPFEATRCRIASFGTVRPFHGLKTVAPIKERAGPGHEVVHRPFHGLKTVASLKHFGVEFAQDLDGKKFHGLKTRGPFEASSTLTRWPSATSLPRFQARGPIALSGTKGTSETNGTSEINGTYRSKMGSLHYLGKNRSPYTARSSASVTQHSQANFPHMLETRKCCYGAGFPSQATRRMKKNCRNGAVWALI